MIRGIDPGPFAQTLRRAHCSHEKAGDPEHICVGICTIKRDGVFLDCTACGSGSEPLAPQDYENTATKAIMEAAGIRWSALTPESQRAAVDEYQRKRSR